MSDILLVAVSGLVTLCMYLAYKNYKLNQLNRYIVEKYVVEKNKRELLETMTYGRSLSDDIEYED